MLKECNVWTFLTTTVLAGSLVYIFHLSIDNEKYPIVEYDRNTGKCKLFINDEYSNRNEIQ